MIKYHFSEVKDPEAELLALLYAIILSWPDPDEQELQEGQDEHIPAP